MKKLSFLKCFINIILFIVYVLVIMFIAGLVYGAISGGQSDTAMYDKIAYLVILVVLIVTTICRKIFYKSIWSETEEVTVKKSYTKMVKEKQEKVKDSAKIKVYVDKEIK